MQPIVHVIKIVFETFTQTNNAKDNIVLAHMERHAPRTKRCINKLLFSTSGLLWGTLQAWQLTFTQANTHTY